MTRLTESAEVREALAHALRLDLDALGIAGLGAAVQLVPHRISRPPWRAGTAARRRGRGRRARGGGTGEARRRLHRRPPGREEGLLPLVHGVELPRERGSRHAGGPRPLGRLPPGGGGERRSEPGPRRTGRRSRSGTRPAGDARGAPGRRYRSARRMAVRDRSVGRQGGHAQSPRGEGGRPIGLRARR